MSTGIRGNRTGTMRSTIATAAQFFLLIMLFPGATVGQDGNGTGIDGQENIFGATNINATTGHGALSVGVSAEGDVTVLSWPGPSHNDQLAYISSNALDARSQPRFGAPEQAGIVLGLRLERPSGTEVTWLRDSTTWERTQSYGPTDGPNPHTIHTSTELGLTVGVVDAVHPQEDLLVRSVSVTRDPGSDVTGAHLLTYANLSPQPPNVKIPELPIADWVMDGRNDYAAVWDPDAQAVIHFHPQDQRLYDQVADLLAAPEADYGPVGQLLMQTNITEMEVRSTVASLGDDYADGAWWMMTSVPAPDGFQVGYDSFDWCAHGDQLLTNIQMLPTLLPGFTLPFGEEVFDGLRCEAAPDAIVVAEGWQYAATDAWQDAADGDLQGHLVAAGEVAEAIRTPLTFDMEGRATASVLFGAGKDLASARSAIAAGATPEAVIETAEAVVEQWLAERNIPGEGNPGVEPATRRALLNLRVGTDARTGAVVASIARQPPYYLDWPRDGAFFNLMLDVTGQSDLVDQRIELYETWQRKSDVLPTPIIDPPPPVDPRFNDDSVYPAYAWEMNYYADGTVGGLFRFEIDTTAFTVWTTVAHVGWVDDPTAYLERYWPMIESATNLLAEWRDPETGLQAPAQEDDAAAHTQTLHGAITVFGALDLAARAARLLDRNEEAEAWEIRAAELRRAIDENFYNNEDGHYFMQDTGRVPFLASGLTPVGPTAWLVWPNSLYPLDSRPIQDQLSRDWALVEPIIDLEELGGLYFTKNTLALAMAGDSTWDQVIADLPARLAALATPGTHQFGENMLVVGEEGVARADQRTATPHLWAGALFFLTVAAVENPQALLLYDEVLPPSRVLAGEVTSPMDDPDQMERYPEDDFGVFMEMEDAVEGESGSNDDCGCAIRAPQQRTQRARKSLLLTTLLACVLLFRRKRRK